MTLEPDAPVRPRAPVTRPDLRARVLALRAAGVPCRVGAALVCPEDLAKNHDRPNRLAHLLGRRQRAREFYGWSLLYRSRGTPRIGLIDPHPTLPELPAFFVSPRDLLEHSDLLARRGIPSRPIMLFTERDDFVADPAGGLVNRFFPLGVFRRRGGLADCG